MRATVSRRVFVITIAAAALAACGPLRTGAGDTAKIIFSNQSLDQADVYAVTGAGEPVRIGTVTPNRTETLTLPPPFSTGTDFAIIARVLSRPSLITGRLSMRPGESVQIRLSSDERTLAILPAK
jgi:hypothetical protein